MLALFRFFLAFFLGVDPDLAERLTDLQAWSNPIAQVQAMTDSLPRRLGAVQGGGFRPARRPERGATGAGRDRPARPA